MTSIILHMTAAFLHVAALLAAASFGVLSKDNRETAKDAMKLCVVSGAVFFIAAMTLQVLA